MVNEFLVNYPIETLSKIQSLTNRDIWEATWWLSNAQVVFWTSYVRLIYVLRLGGLPFWVLKMVQPDFKTQSKSEINKMNAMEGFVKKIWWNGWK